MCATCGCGTSDGVTISAAAASQHEHHLDHNHGHDHEHDHEHEHGHGHDRQHRDHERRRVVLERDLLARNDEQAHRNRHRFAHAGVLALNLVSSPGSGKTTLLVATIERLLKRLDGTGLGVAVIEGDQQTSLDAQRIRATGVPAVQVNTGAACHLDAEMIDRALAHVPLERGGILFIENVGNLVCPAAFDLGEAHKVALLSVTEGEDKPAKYPAMFRAADLVLVNKCDLLPYLDVDVERIGRYVASVAPGARVLRTAATTGLGLDAWVDWILAAAEGLRREPVDAGGRR